MSLLVRVIGVRYAMRTELNEDGPGTDGIVVLQEVTGTRHGAIMFSNAMGTELLEAQHRNPGEPLVAHELFIDILRLAGVEITALAFGSLGDRGGRPGLITFMQGERSWSRAANAFDIAGFSIATNRPVSIDDGLFASMHAIAPPLRVLMGDGELNAEEFAVRLALTADPSKLGNA